MNMRKEGETKTGGKNGDGEVVLLFLGWEACYQPSCLHWPLLAIEGQTVSTSLPPFNCRVVPDSYMEPTWWTACPPHIHNNPSVCSFCFSCSREIFILGFCFSRFTFICIVSCVFFPPNHLYILLLWLKNCFWCFGLSIVGCFVWLECWQNLVCGRGMGLFRISRSGGQSALDAAVGMLCGCLRVIVWKLSWNWPICAMKLEEGEQRTNIRKLASDGSLMAPKRPLWNCSGMIWELLWNCSETARIFLQNCSKLLWNCSRIGIELLWNCSDISLK